MSKLFENKYGYFDAERGEYVIKRADTPRPWVNIISNPDFGTTLSQAGSGYTWRDHAQFNRLTRWDQDLTRDNWGKYVYVRDEETGEFWSPTPKPAGTSLSDYECRHGMGYSILSGASHGIRSEMTVFVDHKDPVEVWILRLTNTTDKVRKLSTFTYLEWCLGVAPDSHREFDKIFIETSFDAARGALFARKTRWALPDPSGRPWSRPYPFFGFHATLPKAISFESDQSAFLGQLGELAAPKAVREGKLGRLQGRCTDGISSLQTRISLKPGEVKEVVFLLGATPTKAEAVRILGRYARKGEAAAELKKVQADWQKRVGELTVKTPDESVNLLVNQWLPYQAISCRMWGRTAYYQTGGAYGYRDQLQDSLATLPLQPGICREHIARAARHQFADGTTFHWWHPITEDGMKKKNSDDLLWLPFVTMQYLKATGDYAFLKETVPFFDKGETTIEGHCVAAIEQVLGRPCPRGIPTMVEGDWNDGLSCIGFDGTSESIWLGEFYYGILVEWCELLRKLNAPGAKAAIARYEKAAAKIKDAINKYAWDGDWYIRATYVNGKLGSHKNKIGKIWLNAQTWALMYGIPSEERREKILKSLSKYLYREYGPLLFTPAFSEPDPSIGHITQYAPGLRENGGLYTHAGCWAIIAEALAGTPDRTFEVFNSFNPIQRGKKPDDYRAEPYVTPGNVDGPESSNFGRGGWTWYSGSAAWMYRALTDYLLGVRPTHDGLLIQPSIPGAWKNFSMVRHYRGAAYEISVINRAGSKPRTVQLLVDGQPVTGNVIPPAPKGRQVKVDVILNPA
ncbi:MAG: hypothetical protein A2X46_18715 [Lentisphaerae bacterium GWF2_57_35]|nr:MAG: hypothetical protein A2X46_18715 [Lentisphaerae bacterium GWF2_57_35]